MPNHFWRSLAALCALATTLTACQDASTAPSISSPRPEAPRLLTVKVADTTITTFTYNPSSAKYQTFSSEASVYMPSGAVCNLLTSGYGPAVWDAPCAPATLPIPFTVKTWRTADGRPQMTIAPDVRFVPGKTVTLFMYKTASADSVGGVIAWCPTGGGECVDEGVADVTLLSHDDSELVYRRIKHFSGYNVTFGRRPPPEGGQ